MKVIIERLIMTKLKHFWFLGIMLMLLSFNSNSLSAAENIQGSNSNIVDAVSLQQEGIKNPGSDLWRNVRQRDATITGLTQVKGLKTGTLIDTKGNQWRKFRREMLLPYGGYFIMGALGVVALLFIIIRRQKIPNGRSGKTITRMSTMQMITHWFLVVIVGFMSITGLLLLFGRFVIIPLMGASAFSPIASASKEGHNLMGPLLVISLLMMLIYYLRHNWPAKGDLKWLFTVGGLFSKKHLEVGYFNAGEKILFWSTMILCVLLSLTGLLLLFPYYEPTIERTQLALLIHAIAALALIAMVFGHIWMVYTVEGTFDAMNSGEVDENWAKSHHSRWYKETTNTAEIEETESTSSSEKPSGKNEEGAYS